MPYVQCTVFLALRLARVSAMLYVMACKRDGVISKIRCNYNSSELYIGGSFSFARERVAVILLNP